MRKRKRIIKAGVYRFRNKLNNHAYIGSSENVDKRYDEHVEFRGSKRLGIAIKKHGIENFEYEVLEPIDNRENLDRSSFRNYVYDREQIWLDMYFAQEYIESNGKDRKFMELTYNTNPKAKGSTGLQWSDEQRQKLSVKYKLKSHWEKGRTIPIEQIEKIKRTKAERGITVDGKNNPNYGHKSTSEKRAKYLATKKERGSLIKFYRIDKELKIDGPFYGLVAYAKDNKLEPRGLDYCINNPDRSRKYKGYTYCKEEDIEKRIELIKTHPNFWGYHKFKKEYYVKRGTWKSTNNI